MNRNIFNIKKVNINKNFLIKYTLEIFFSSFSQIISLGVLGLFLVIFFCQNFGSFDKTILKI